MKLKSYNILFRIFSFLSDKTDGAPLFVKYKLLLGTLIIGMATSAKAQEKVNEQDTISSQQVSIRCYKATIPPKENTLDEIEISGNVKDENGEPLPNATVLIKNSTQGTLADEYGNFTIKKVKADDKLVFSFFGCKTQEVSVSKIKDGKVNVVLKNDGIILCYETVVVKTHKKKESQQPKKPAGADLQSVPRK